MAGDGQQSNVQATRNGIMALESAFTGILRARQDVDNTRANISQGYQGSDGSQFGQLLQKWDEQANIILKNLEDMIDKLNTSLTQHGQTQYSTNEAINQSYKQSEAVFHTLIGP